ncbi:MAG TPA: NUDIX hydrolase [Tianweitania sediminis]|nr:NUDIX hydrolase [Tianweitania sediminis]
MALKEEGAPALQAGAMPYAIVQNQIAFLLITSRRTGRWIFPKGAVFEGLAPWDSAAQEALEEAGVEGQIETFPIGSYRSVKHGVRRSVIEVELYPLKVERQHEEWPEMRQRHRHWAILPEVTRLITDKPLAGLAVRLAQRFQTIAR